MIDGKSLSLGLNAIQGPQIKDTFHSSFSIFHFSFLSLVMLAFFLSCNFVDQFFLLASSNCTLGCPLRVI